MITTGLLENILCPICKGELKQKRLVQVEGIVVEGKLFCSSCCETFPIANKILNILQNSLPHLQKDVRVKWEGKLRLLNEWWKQERGNHQDNGRKLNNLRLSSKFINRYFNLATGLAKGSEILDIGCGDGERFRHFYKLTYVGIDPLIQKDVFEFPFIRGIGELLPFKDGFFNVVISVESFDHFLDPEKCLGEALRVLKPNGNIMVFVKSINNFHEKNINKHFLIKESDVHLHKFSAIFFKKRISDSFAHFELFEEGNYQAVFGWEKK